MSASAAALAGKVGPNAISQLADVLQDRYGVEERRAVLSAAGLAKYLAAPPERMTDEREAAALHQTVRTRHGRDWDNLSWEAGERTARYLLAHRIPGGAQWLLRRMPATWAARMLLGAIAKHAWTFAGSGQFAAHVGDGLISITIADNPIAMPGCPWHGGVFTRLFRTLVSPRVTVVHEACCAEGAAACRFALRWR